MVFNARAGAAINASIIDLGSRFRLLINEVEAVPVERPMPKLPVARVLWRVLPNLRDGVESWILAGGAHHTGFSYNVTADQMEQFAEMAGIESVLIGRDTNPAALRRELVLADMAWKLRG